MCCETMPTRSAVDAIGSSVGGSPTVATLMTPPFSCAKANDDEATSAVPRSSAILADFILVFLSFVIA
ncbi:hypothetical protein D3C72_2410020 [compost metagenome]